MLLYLNVVLFLNQKNHPRYENPFYLNSLYLFSGGPCEEKENEVWITQNTTHENEGKVIMILDNIKDNVETRFILKQT